MLLVRDFVAHMASEVVKRLVEGGQIEVKARDAVTTRIRQRMLEELTVEDRLNEDLPHFLVEPVLDGQLLEHALADARGHRVPGLNLNLPALHQALHHLTSHVSHKIAYEQHL